MNARTKSASTTGDRYLDGQLLLAMPTMTDKRFRRAVIYMCRHSDEGAMGIIVNQRAKSLSLPTLLMQIGIVDEVDEAMADRLGERTVHVGGPVSGERGFVLHTSDYTVDDATLPIADGICLTATVDILKAIANGTGPASSLLALGYSGWAPGQLESELGANGWLHCPADHSLVFSDEIEHIYDRALSKLGVDPTFLVSAAGRA